MPAPPSHARGPRAGVDRAPRAARGPLPALRDALIADPVVPVLLLALAVLIAWASDQAGYPQTHWAPGGLILLALLAIAVGATGISRARTPRSVKVAIGALAAFTALSFLSILWAKVPGDAWEGADRTLLYLIVFTLFARWRRAGVSAALLLGAWVLAMAGLGIYTVLHVEAASSHPAEIQSLMSGGRLVFPAGYTNANAALWMMAAFPALILATARQLPSAVRGLMAGAAVLLCGVALYSQSRGSVYSIPIVLVLIFLFLPGRVRTLAMLIPVGAGVAALAPAVLHLDKQVEAGAGVPAAAHSATLAVLLAAAVIAVIVGLAAAVEARRPLSQAAGARLHRGVAALGIIAAVALIAGVLVAVGNPIARAEKEWRTFTSIKGYAANSKSESRLVGGLGSNRYDFYRVAWEQFEAHPLLGIGVENFAVPYLRLGRSNETPHYPHSIEMAVLSQTGAIGMIVALIGLIAALIASRGALRSSDRLGRVVAAAALAGFAYFMVHGSFDWFFEYAGLGAAAFAMLGLSCSLCPAPASEPAVPHRSRRRLALRIGLTAAGVAAALAAAYSLAVPWLSRMDVQSAGRIWTVAPQSAYARLRQAAQLNPLSDEANLVAGSIALRFGDLPRAEQQFALALGRSPEDSYATLEQGAIASARGERAVARRLLTRAVQLAPRDPVVREALAIVERGQRVEIAELNRSILREAKEFS